MKPICIFFDLDNTLVDRPASLTQYAEQFASDFSDRLGDISVPNLDHAIQDFDGGGYKPKDEMFANVVAHLPWTTAPTVDEIETHWFDVYPQKTVGMTGFRQVLRDVHERDIRTGLLTNGRTRTQDTKVDLLDIRGLLDCIVISEAEGCKKPDPRIFNIALDKAGTTPEETWFVGDNPVNDVIGATRMGITGIWMSGFHEWPADEPAPQFEIDALDQLGLLIDIADQS
jgi:putative hydrolase of the HAD superfamily